MLNYTNGCICYVKYIFEKRIVLPTNAWQPFWPVQVTKEIEACLSHDHKKDQHSLLLGKVWQLDRNYGKNNSIKERINKITNGTSKNETQCQTK